MQILLSDRRLVNNRMRTLTYALWTLTMIILVYGLVGCANIQSTLDTGIGQVPGQRVQGSVTVYRW
jgi:hypothetical protein